MNATATVKRIFKTDDERWTAVVARDRSADGAFVISVRTTGIYCRPGCPARTPRRENVRFHVDWRAAEQAGFRACKRCRPKSVSPAVQQSALIAEACRMIERAEEVPSLSVLARSAGLSASRFHRVFKSVTGVTPRGYAAALRSERAGRSLRSSRSVTEAIHASGFGSMTRPRRGWG
jgi:AraC family transcriptional regulator of adaptative response/methylated-DNA-[protein]-cysteine methyltransferase